MSDPRHIQTHSGESPTAQDKQHMADIHEAPPGTFKANPSSMGPNVGPPGVSFHTKTYASTLKGLIAGSGQGLGAHPLGSQKKDKDNAQQS